MMFQGNMMFHYTVHFGKETVHLERAVPIQTGDIVVNNEDGVMRTWKVIVVVHHAVGHSDCTHLYLEKVTLTIEV